ncbi:hypothetical protein CPB85DRAFT_574 [Mucidula mucida]|nr:hypothetical protein CPB85DRAFT_574 [Mucidula mucida]
MWDVSICADMPAQVRAEIEFALHLHRPTIHGPALQCFVENSPERTPFAWSHSCSLYVFEGLVDAVFHNSRRMASEIRFTSTLHQCDEPSLVSLRSILRGEIPLLPYDRVRIADVASAWTRDIAVAQEHLTRLQSHCNAARRQLALHYSALAPIRNLPPDVLISIFEHTLRQNYSYMDVGKPPWTLAQVCCSWRGIMLSAHSLWARMIYNSRRDPGDTIATATMTTEITQEYLRRSGQHPLTVVLRGEYHGPIYSLVLKESHRWKILYVEAINSTFASRWEVCRTWKICPLIPRKMATVTYPSKSHSSSVSACFTVEDFHCLRWST